MHKVVCENSFSEGGPSLELRDRFLNDALMHRTFLLGHRSLPRYDPQNNPREAATIAALALYFDRVYLIDLASRGTWERIYDDVSRRFAMESGESVWSGIVTRGFHEELSRQDQFRANYRTLITASILFPVDIAETVSPDVKLTPRDCARGFLSGIQQVSLEDLVEAQTIIRDTISSDAIPDDIAAMILLYTDLIPRESSNYTPWVTALKGHADGAAFVSMLGILASIFVRNEAASVAHHSVVALSELHLRLWSLLRTARNRRHDYISPKVEPLASQLLSAALARMPTILPRSVESILEVRERLQSPLEVFRSRVRRLAERLVLDGEPDWRGIQRSAVRDLVEPLEDLKAKLQTPTRALARNLVSNSAILTAGVSLLATAASQAPGVITAGVGVASSMLAAALKTLVEQRDAVDASGVGFLLRLDELSRRSA